MAGRIIKKMLIVAVTGALVAALAKEYPAIKREVKIWLM